MEQNGSAGDIDEGLYSRQLYVCYAAIDRNVEFNNSSQNIFKINLKVHSTQN